MTGFSCRVDVGKGEEREDDFRVLSLSWSLWLELFARVSAIPSLGHWPPDIFDPRPCQNRHVSPLHTHEFICKSNIACYCIHAPCLL